MLNNRELQLQTIIKTLQSKIYSLKRQLSNAQKTDQSKIQDQVAKVVLQKQKTIDILMEQNQKLKLLGKQEQSWKFTKLANDFSSTERNMESLKSSNHDLEVQIMQIKKHYEQLLEQKQSELKSAGIKVQASVKERKKLLDEVQKINRFYVESIKRKPDRQETLLWVDKLIQFMTKTSQIVTEEEKNRKQALNSVTLFFKDEFTQLANQISKNQSSISIEKNSFLTEIQRWVAQAQIDYKSALKQNEQFWQGFIKIKVKEDKQTISRLQHQLQEIQSQKQKELQELTELLNENQKQKKGLLVSLQELRNYYQLRDKANKEQMELLRKSLSDLLDSQQLRQRQFETQLSRMGDHIQHLTSKFYQKIQLPINSVYNKIKEEVSKFKNHFQGFLNASTFQRQIQTFQQQIVQYLVYLNHYKDLRQLIKESARECLKITDFLKLHQFSSESREGESFGVYSSVTRESYLSLDTNKEQKLVYELATAKKHIEKLKQYVKQLQSKTSGNKGNTSLTNSKIIELTAENESYQERIQKMERNNRQGFAFNQQSMEQNKIGRVNTALLERLLQKSEEIYNFTIRQEEYIVLFSGCINSLNQLIINPIQTFQTLIKEIKSISVQQLLPPSWTNQGEKQPSIIDLERKKQFYRDILAKKSDISTCIQKSNLQLIKVVRQYLSRAQNLKSIKESETSNLQKQKIPQSKQMLQKRLKEVHNQRLKSKEQFLGGLKILQEKIKNLDLKYSKKQSLPLGRLQQLIVKKINQMMVVYEPKDKFKDIGRITEQALLDAKSKLKDCQLQNEGLLRQLQLYKLTRQNSKNE